MTLRRPSAAAGTAGRLWAEADLSRRGGSCLSAITRVSVAKDRLAFDVLSRIRLPRQSLSALLTNRKSSMDPRKAQTQKRREDARFIRGAGLYTVDSLPYGLLHVAFARSRLIVA